MGTDNGKFPHLRGQREERPRMELDAPDAGPPRAQDYWRINLREDWEITFWTREFGCTEEALKQAVAATGELAGGVRAYLQDQHQQRRT